MTPDLWLNLIHEIDPGLELEPSELYRRLARELEARLSGDSVRADRLIRESGCIRPPPSSK